ncbi:nuclear transport factor 2 family protein [Cupriavidus lacunae]|nr:nuclear transport factor 2 family protein [Cupriavidus lacunae]
MEDQLLVLHLLQKYLDALHEGDAPSLAKLFDPEAAVFGMVRGEAVHKPVATYLDGVANRNSPRALGEPYRMRILSVQVVGNIASAKVHVPLLGNNYYNFLSLRKRDDRWWIINKLYAHVDA